MSKLSDIGEFGLIERLRRFLPTSPAVLEGVGDDCALLRLPERKLLVSCDMAVEGIHFSREHAPPSAIGWKVAAASLSDIAAMGGVPMFCLVSIGCPRDTEAAFVEELYKGLVNMLSRFGVVLVGGDTTCSPERLVIDVTVMGHPSGARCVQRRGARAGDLLALTGHVGLAAAGLDALQRGADNPTLVNALFQPNPRILEGQWLSNCGAVHAMVDISDGLVQDGGHIADAAHLGLLIDPEALPILPPLQAYCQEYGLDPVDFMLSGGEDYELAFAVSPVNVEQVIADFHREYRTTLTVVGEFVSDYTGVRVSNRDVVNTGFDHFQRG